MKTWTALIFSDPGERIPPFAVLKVVKGDLTAAGASPRAALARLKELEGP